MTLSLILPCYNPPQGWDRNIYSSYTALGNEINATAELIVVLDGTSQSVTEDNLAYLRQMIPAIKLVNYSENRGKGYAIRQGAAIASGDIIIYTDIDFPYTLQSICNVYNALDAGGCDVVIGVKDDEYYRHVPELRKIISRCLRFMTGAFLSLPITDTQCGLKGFRKQVTPLFLKTTIDRYLFDIEFIRNCFKAKKFSIKALPVTLNEKVQFRKMNYSVLLPEMINFARLLFKKPHDI